MELDRLNPRVRPAVSSVAPPFDPFSLAPYPEDYWDRIESRKCCKENESAIKVDWVHIGCGSQNSDCGQTATARKFTSLAELQSYTSESNRQDDYELRVISIHQANSWRPLNITKDMLETILEYTNISTEFLEIALSFYGKSTAVEEAFCSAPVFKYDANSIEICYIFKHAFFKPPDEVGKDPWSLRQVGVCQKFDLGTKRSTWIFLHPTTESIFQTRLMQHLKSTKACSQIQESPLRLHNVLFSTCFPQWREYLAYYEARVLSLSNTLMSTRLDEPMRVDHQTLTSIRFVENRCLPLRAIFRSLDKTFETIRKANNSFLDARIVQKPEHVAISQLLDNHSNQLDAYSQNAMFLQSRTARTAQLMADTLSHQISFTAQAQSNYMLDDSATVRVITIVTLIYLPPTFMATVLGMNSFFQMDAETHKVVASPQFWIYILCSVPLTVATVLFWWLRRRRHPEARKVNESLDV